MKKEMFNRWYKKYGEKIAKNSLPIDDANEKEIRVEAKLIFSSVYDMMTEYVNEKVMSLCNHIASPLQDLKKYENEILAKKKIAEMCREELIPHMTRLYDSYYTEHTISRKQFDSLRKYFGEILSDNKKLIMIYNQKLSSLKKEKKNIESIIGETYDC